MDKTIQAKHIPDETVLGVIQILRTGKGPYASASRWSIIESFKPIPWKVINAKLSSMVRRGLIDGCVGCTCHGNFTIKEQTK